MSAPAPSRRVERLGTVLISELGWLHAIPLEDDHAVLMFHHYGLKKSYSALADAAGAVPAGTSRRIREVVRRRVALADLNATVAMEVSQTAHLGPLRLWYRIIDTFTLRVWRWRFRRRYLRHVEDITRDVRTRDTLQRETAIRQVASREDLDAEIDLLDRLEGLLNIFASFRRRIDSTSSPQHAKDWAIRRLEETYHRELVRLEREL